VSELKTSGAGIDPEAAAPGSPSSPWAYVRMARIDHWIKNVFVLPGILVALSIEPHRIQSLNWVNLVIGLLAVCFISSSNYVLNELLDAPSDRFHPAKALRAAASGGVNRAAGYLEWLALLAAGLALGWRISGAFVLVMLGLWVMGCLYNIPPIRTKDVPYLDVLSEALNNPLRMLAGWYMTGTAAVPITTLLISYWMIGCYFMAIKRYAEYREIEAGQLMRYRKSFEYYSERSLLVSIMFYGSHAMLFFGGFIVRYRLELILAFPLVALVMAVYFWLAFKKDSAVQHPEGLYKEPALMIPVVLCAAVMIALLFVDVPFLHNLFQATTPGL
jgi:decaprenyl-phosphate phosphoribosyltransferase